MKALFVHDHFYYTDADGTTLSRGQYHHSIWDRYLTHFDNLTIIGRDGGHASKHENGINVASCDHAAFNLFENKNSLSGLLNRTDLKKEIAKLVSDHDVIILRGISEFGAIAYEHAKKHKKLQKMQMRRYTSHKISYKTDTQRTPILSRKHRMYKSRKTHFNP
jgi:hypothetical protein